MKTYIVRIKISMPEGHETHNTKIQAINLEDAMLRFAELAKDDNKFIAIVAFTARSLNAMPDELDPPNYGVVFPITSVLEVLYQEV